MDKSQIIPGTSEGGGPSSISVVVTTVITPTSITASESPASSDSTRRRMSPIKLVGVGGLERQNYCCGHWFPSTKSYHRHLAEKALMDLTHEMKLIELGMLRCAHCSMWVHVESMSGHLRKSHGIIKVNKTSKIIPSNVANEITGISGDTLKTGTNFVIKVSGQSAVRSSNGEISSSNINTMANSSTVKLVTTSSGSLYHKVQQFQHAAATGMGKVIVHKSTPTPVPVVSRGPRIVMKSVGRRSVIPLNSTPKGLSHPQGSQAISAATTTARNINGITTVQISGGNMTVLSNASERTPPTKSVGSQEELSNMNGQSLKLMKKIANVKSRNKNLNSQAADASPSTELALSTKTKEKGKAASNGETLALKPSQAKKSRKQVLKPSVPDVSYDADTPLSVNGKIKKRGRKPSVEAEVFNTTKVNNAAPTINHRGYRRKLRETRDSENYTPKTARQTSKGVRGGWKKKKRGPGRPRKIRIDETPDLSEIDSLFDEVNKEDLENEPVLVKKKEEENVPTVELDLFTLPSLNEQVSVLLTEPQNPNFKVYASMDAIFVGDSALGDVTNQIGYVTDSNNVVFVNPSHFLFPNVEDLENFVPSPILTMKGSKVGFTPVRQMWKLNASKTHTPVVLRDNKFITLTVSKEASKESSCDGSEKASLDDRESQVPSVSQKQKGKEKVVKEMNVEQSQTENVLNVKPLKIVKPDVGKDADGIKNDDTASARMDDITEAETLLFHQDQSISKATKALTSPERNDVRTLRRRSSSQMSDGKEEEKDAVCSDESIPVAVSEEDISLACKSPLGVNQDTVNAHQSETQDDLISLACRSPPEINQDTVNAHKSETEDDLISLACKSPLGINQDTVNAHQSETEDDLISLACKSPPGIHQDTVNAHQSETEDDLISLACKSPSGINQDTVNAHQSETQDDLISSQEVKSESLKSPLKLQKTSITSTHVTEILKSPSISDMEDVIQKDDVLNSITSCNLSSGNILDLETSCLSPLKSENASIITQEVEVENSLSSVELKTTPTHSCNNIVNDSVLSTSKENVKEETVEYSSHPEMKQVSCVEDLATPKKKDLFRRRRSRTKSADTIGQSTINTQQDREYDFNDKDNFRRQSRRKTRQLSESSVMLEVTRTNEQDRLSISDMTYRLRMEHLPLRLGEQSGKKEVFGDLVEQMSYPVTPSDSKTSPSSAECRTVPSGSPEKETEYLLKTRENRETALKLRNEADCKTPVRLGRRRRRSSKLLESLGVEPLKANSTTGSVEGTPSLEDNRERDIKERLCDLGNAQEIKSAREKQIVDSITAISPNLKRACSPHPAEHHSSTGLSDQTVVRQHPVDSVTENSHALSQVACKPCSVLSVKTEEESLQYKENKKAKLPKAELVTPVSPLRESDLSPSREWHGRGAKLKAQVLIQDQQAGVTDSQIIPSSPDGVCHTKDTLSVLSNTAESSSPRKATSPNCEKQVTLSSPQLKPPSSATSPTSPNVSKSPKSPRSLQDREWQARGAKLRAQIMISDQQNSMMEYTEENYSQSPPAKKMKTDSPPGTVKDIRSFFTLQKSRVQTPPEEQHCLASPGHSGNSTAVTKKVKKYSYAKSDIRSFFSSSANTKRKCSTARQRTCTKNAKAKKITFSIFPKKSPKKEDVHAVHLLRKEFEFLENRISQLSVPTLPSASCDFEGFDRCSRQSGLRAKSLLRLVSLLSMKRWYHLGKFPLPVDELCDWDDELLSCILFD